MSKINIGRSGIRSVDIDLATLLRTRMLIQANSGGGKSWLLRRLAEQMFGKVQVIIIDPEGEFSTLREEYDFALVGVGGEVTAEVRHAKAVAERLMELRLSAVCDLFEAFRKTPGQRHEWVKAFCDGLLDCPKKLWHPVVLIIDEFHKFVPERGAGESVASEAVIGVGTAGRKRGICLIGATQRLGKVRKDVSAELLNRLVGPTFEDVDVERAADLLSVTKDQKPQFYKQMRVLEPGHFFAFGRAVAKERVLVTVGKVVTTHPEMGAKYGSTPPPTAKIRALLPKLADLPKQAEDRVRTEAELKGEIRSLKAQIRATPVVKDVQTRVEVKKVEVPVLSPSMVNKMTTAAQKISRVGDQVSEAFRGVHKTLASIEFELRKKQPQFQIPPVIAKPVSKPVPVPVPVPVVGPTASLALAPVTKGDITITAMGQKILNAIAEFNSLGVEKPKRVVIAAACGWSLNGHVKNTMGGLRSAGMVDYPSADRIVLTDAGRQNAHPVETPISNEEMLNRCLKVCTGLEQKILKQLHSVWPDEVLRSDAADRIGQSYNGHVKNSMGTLRSKEMVTYPTTTTIKCADWLMVEETGQ